LIFNSASSSLSCHSIWFISTPHIASNHLKIYLNLSFPLLNFSSWSLTMEQMYILPVPSFPFLLSLLSSCHLSSLLHPVFSSILHQYPLCCHLLSINLHQELTCYSHALCRSSTLTSSMLSQSLPLSQDLSAIHTFLPLEWHLTCLHT
jgi:hypothetical protein